jgi:hypothetical protein
MVYTSLFIFERMGKSKLYIFCFLLFFSKSACSQGFEAALILGANFSQIDGDQLGGYNKLGVNTGFAISRQIDQSWKWSFEILYAMKGSKKRIVDPQVSTPSLRIDLHYIEIPLLVRYGLRNLEFYGGPTIGINVFNRREDNGFISKQMGLRPLEFSLHLGGTYYLGPSWGLDLRHSYSLVSITDKSVNFVPQFIFRRAGMFNRLFSVGLRYNFGS